MKNSTAKKIVRLLTDEDFLDNHNMKERALWVRKIAEKEVEKKPAGYCPTKSFI
jgi:hypothetical protein